MRLKTYKYNVDDIIEVSTGKIKILKQIRMGGKNEKGYIYQCLICGNIDEIFETNIVRGSGCNVCCRPSKKVLKGYNDIATTHKWMVELLENEDDAYKYMAKSHNSINFKCPDCGNIYLCIISNVSNRGKASCPSCGKGKSYPNKFMFNVLQQLAIDFKAEYSPKWCRYLFKEKYRQGHYDFYIPSMNIIIEMDGGLGHGNDNTLSDLNCLESKYIDNEKDLLANKHGKQIIRIDCNYYNMEVRFNHIKQNILNSKLNEIFDLFDIDWNKCDEYSNKSVIGEISELWNMHKDINVISNILKIHKNTVRQHLVKCNELGIIDYSVRPMDEYVPILLVETGEIFYNANRCAKELSERIGMVFYANCIKGVCDGIYKFHRDYHFSYAQI